ncbi:hypothetical protein COO59_08935 [Mixta theicola]|uniref:Bacterial Ig-like domain-containing protein n=1 Tax=Mixta theicola TaxID=1458355 RepID=A0A2K1QAM6_9GAMM|nr:hypothetical protein [Mixta theicola]PNS12093.1 hypothetical protein COO59_08935 [Mixta theicola]GLR10738.1 hypothetical protein GCM10007905_34580 [Mixta theicola]
MANTANQQRLAAAIPFSTATLQASLASTIEAAALTAAPNTAAGVAVDSSTTHGTLLASAVTDDALSINPISIDNIVGYYEHGNATVISGYARTGSPGDTVSVTLHGKTYSGTLGSDAMWYVNVPESDIAQIPNGEVAVSATHTDSAGMLHQASSQFSLQAGNGATSGPVLFLNKVTGDDVLSAVERGGDLLISGWGRNITEGREVTITLNGHQYHTTTTKDSRWTISIPGEDVQALPQGNITLLASLGYEARVAEVAKTLTLNNQGEGKASPSLSIDTVSADDTISLYEIGAATFITGHSTHIPGGSRIKLTVSDKVFYGDVTDDGVWSVRVEQLYNARNTSSTHAVVSWQDSDGNQVAASREIHLVPSSYPYKYPMAFQIDTISVDGRLDGQEAQNDLIITGSRFSGENLGFGETVYVTLNGKTYTGVVEGGDYDNHWQITVPASDVQALPPGSYTVVASINATVNAGASVNSTQTKTFTVIDPDLAFNPISGNNAVSAHEHGNATVFSGYAHQGAPGDTVLITLHGKTYSGTLGNDAMWYVSVPESDIAAIPNGKVTVRADHTDTAGMEHHVTSEFTLTNAVTTLPSLFINKVTGDDVLSAVERGGDLLVSGWGRYIGNGYEVQVSLNGHTYSTKTTNDSRWIVTIPHEDLQALPLAGQVTLVASLPRGNEVNEVATTLTLNANGEGNETPLLSMNPFFGDDDVNYYETAAPQYVTGHAEHLAAGSTVKLVVGDQTYKGQVTSDGLWSVYVDRLPSLSNGDTTHATVSYQDKDGNQFADSRQIEIGGLGYAYHYPMTFTFDPIGGDQHLSGSEKHQDLTISSSHSSGEGLGMGGAVTVLLNGKTYTTTSEAGPDNSGFDNHWQVAIPASDIEALAPGSYTVIATLTDSFVQNNQEITVRDVQAKMFTVDDDGVATLSSSLPTEAETFAVSTAAMSDSAAQADSLDNTALGLHHSEPSAIGALLDRLAPGESATQQDAAAEKRGAVSDPLDVSPAAETVLPAAPADMWHNPEVGAQGNVQDHDAVYAAAAPAETTLADTLQQHLQPVV